MFLLRFGVLRKPFPSLIKLHINSARSLRTSTTSSLSVLSNNKLLHQTAIKRTEHIPIYIKGHYVILKSYSSSDTHSADATGEDKYVDRIHNDPKSFSQNKSQDVVDVDKELLRYNIEEFYPDEEEEDEEEEDSTQNEEANLSGYVYEDFYGIEIGEQHFKPDVKNDQTKIQRGHSGVFDVNDIVSLLEEQNMTDVCTIDVPPEFQYVKHLVVATGLSNRHLKATAQHIQTQWKHRRLQEDPVRVRADGKKAQTDWIAIDLANVIVHLMLPEAREYYAIESLWLDGEDAHALKIATNVEDRYTFTLPAGAKPSEQDSDILFNQLHKQYFEAHSPGARDSVRESSIDIQEKWDVLHSEGWDSPRKTFVEDNEVLEQSEETTGIIDKEAENTEQSQSTKLEHNSTKHHVTDKNKESMENVAGWHSTGKL